MLLEMMYENEVSAGDDKNQMCETRRFLMEITA